ncbi:helix-turn-helix transcriptional regulator [Paenibacillus sp. IHBB 3054]|uniref:helix-turn-helix transcriptional regulator n=1 Tax=Paenibacillus sp. IHBB 3054 TaxID=3425689 RepID=UPI003F675D1F
MIKITLGDEEKEYSHNQAELNGDGVRLAFPLLTVNDRETRRLDQLRLMQESFLLQMVREEWLSPEKVKQRLRQLQLHPLADEGVKLQFAAVELQIPAGEIGEPRKRRNQLYKDFQQICRRTAAGSKGVYPFCDAGSISPVMYFLIVMKDNASHKNDRAEHFARELEQNVESRLRLGLAAGIGAEYKGLKRLKNGYASCLLALSGSRSAIPGSGTGLVLQSRASDRLTAFSQATEQRLTLSLEQPASAAFRLELDSLFTLEDGAASQLEVCRFLAQRTLLVLGGAAGKFEYGGTALQKYLWNSQMTLAACTSSEHAKELLQELGQLVMAEVRRTQASGGRELGEAIRKYVKEHFACDLKAPSLAALFHVSEAELSRLFKMHVGIPLNDYVTKLRMAQAEQQLRENTLKCSEIAMLAGYSVTDEFISSFKKYSGRNPKDYREWYLKRQMKV